MQQINQDVLAVLSTVEITGTNVKITEQLDRKLYQQVNEVLERIGGKWNKKAKAHIFNSNPTEKLEAVINSGMLELKIKTGYFPTPEKVVKQMISLLEFQRGDIVLEPSSGQGHIADQIPRESLIMCEILSENRAVLIAKGYQQNLIGDDFLKTHIAGVNKICMNPPFELQNDILHVTHALDCLNPGGILVSVMSSSVLFRNNKKTQKFREDILSYAEVIPLPEGSFKESGTMVNTILVKIRKRDVK